MLKQVIFTIGCAIIVLTCPNFTTAEEAKQAVQSENKDLIVADALAWLTDVDQKRYEKSWEAASVYFKDMVTKEQWVSQVAAARRPFGDLVSRTFKEKKDFTTLPGAPDGEYEVMTFDTVFQNKASAVETVTVMKDKDGQWRLAGYFIK